MSSDACFEKRILQGLQPLLVCTLFSRTEGSGVDRVVDPRHMGVSIPLERKISLFFSSSRIEVGAPVDLPKHRVAESVQVPPETAYHLGPLFTANLAKGPGRYPMAIHLNTGAYGERALSNWVGSVGERSKTTRPVDYHGTVICTAG